LLENKHKYLVKGDIIKYEKTLQACYCGFLIHLIYLRGWGDRSLAQDFSIFNDTFKTMLVTKLQVLLGGKQCQTYLTAMHNTIKNTNNKNIYLFATIK
jgi:hypothetical protein